VWGGHIERDGLNWTVVLDEFLDTDGTPATAAGRWKTGEGAAPGTKTAYSARIWGNDTNHYAAVNLDGFTLHANDANGRKTVDWTGTKLHANNAGNTEILDWHDSGDANRGAYAVFKRGAKFEGEPVRFYDSSVGLYTDPTGIGFAQSMQASSDFGWPWATTSLGGFSTSGGVSMGEHRFKSGGDAGDYASFDIWARHVYADPAGVGMRGGSWSNTYEGTTVTADIATNGGGSSGDQFEGFRCSDGTRRISLLSSDSSSSVDADIYASGTGGRTYGLRIKDKPSEFGAYVIGDSYAHFGGYGQFGSHVNVDASAGEYRVNGTRVVSARKGYVTAPTASGLTGDTGAGEIIADTSTGYYFIQTAAKWDELVTAVNTNRTAIVDIINRLRATGGHGLIQDT